MTLRHAFETIYKPRNLRFASKETIRLWNISLRMFTRFLKRDANVDDLTDENLTAFCMWVEKSFGKTRVHNNCSII